MGGAKTTLVEAMNTAIWWLFVLIYNRCNEITNKKSKSFEMKFKFEIPSHKKNSLNTNFDVP